VVDASPLSASVDVLGLAGALLRFVRALDQQVRSAQPGDALSLAELGVLSLVDQGSDTPTLIARVAHLDPARVTHITDRLVSLGLLVREIDADDRRRWRIQVTKKGVARVATGRKDLDAAMGELVRGLTPGELAGLTKGLEGMRRVLTPSSEA
jgi:DNA-binding MarR family transcriptional regulator